MEKKIKVCHITSVHSSDDARIFHKECISLSNAGYEVYLVAPGESRIQNDIHVLGMGDKPTSIKERATKFASKLVEKALALDCQIYHLHDPELLLYVRKIKKAGKKVIFDSHEDYYFDSRYFPKYLVWAANLIYRNYEKATVAKLDALICCYRKTKERLSKKCSNIEMIYNFPILTEDTIEKQNTSNSFIIGYAGGINNIWNHHAVLKALENIDSIEYRIAGNTDSQYLEILKNTEGWKKVKFYGKIPFSDVKEKVYGSADIGVALLSYIRECNGKEGNLSNTKLFEIMNAGLPVIATDFELWKSVVEDNHCGICVCPYDVEAIENAIIFMMNNPLERKRMGENAKRAIIEKYNWAIDAHKLLKLYEGIK